jgi:hypothetical protein
MAKEVSELKHIIDRIKKEKTREDERTHKEKIALKD